MNSAPASIDCRHFVELVTAYLEGALDEETTRLLDTHLDICHPCIVYVDQMRQTAAALGRLPLGTLSDESRRILLDAFRTAREAAP